MYKKILYLLLPVVLVAGCSHHNKEQQGITTDIVNNPLTASDTSINYAKKESPVFYFVEESYNFGTIKQGEKVEHTFKFKNKGETDLVILSAIASCGCTVPKYSKQAIAPGDEDSVHVIFNSEGKEGKINKTITIIANTIPNSKVLTITGEVNKN